MSQRKKKMNKKNKHKKNPPCLFCSALWSGWSSTRETDTWEFGRYLKGILKTYLTSSSPQVNTAYSLLKSIHVFNQKKMKWKSASLRFPPRKIMTTRNISEEKRISYSFNNVTCYCSHKQTSAQKSPRPPLRNTRTALSSPQKSLRSSAFRRKLNFSFKAINGVALNRKSCGLVSCTHTHTHTVRKQ